MEEVVFGSLDSEGLEIVSRDGRYFVRYDAGTHNVAWREDEITELEADSIRGGRAAEHEAMLGLQKRLEATGVNPYEQNWAPTKPRL
jgi:hypothetical protein